MNENNVFRAVYGAHTIRVYQAYNTQIASAAVKHGRFVSPPFSMTRMTWIKPSFLWMMYRCGWGYKDDGQARVLAIDITHEGFAWALAHSCSSHRDPGMTAAEWEAHKARHPVRVQWDPERDMAFTPLDHRSIQIGLSGEAVQLYVHEWIQGISDITPLAHENHALWSARRKDEAKALLPEEREYQPLM